MGLSIVVEILLVLSLSVIPSTTQQAAPCWTSIASCLESAKAQNYRSEAVQPCCPAISAAINNERPCFCLGKSDFDSQEGGVSFMNNVFQICAISGTLDSICPAQQAAPCWTGIGSCLESAKAQNYRSEAVQPCCPAISAAINNDRSCFCLGKSDLVSQQAGVTIINSIFQICAITGTLDTICPDTPPSSLTGTPLTPIGTPSTPTSPSGTPSAPLTTATPTAASPRGTLPPSTPGTSNNGAIHKIAAKSISGLFMILMPLMIC